MDSKEIKAALKGAREAIRTKDFKEALRQCKTILASDKNNYNALVFIGVAAEGLEQADQALKAYKKATEASPEQLLAWQGLSGFYEKTQSADNDADLVNVYKKLMTLHESDKAKVSEIRRKLAKLLGKLGHFDEAIELQQTLLRDEPAGGERQDVLLYLFELLNSQKTMSPPHQQLMREICQEAIKTGLPADSAEHVLKQYLSLLLKESRPQISAECEGLSQKYPDSLSLLEMRSLVTLEDLVETEGDAPLLSTLREVSERLETLSPDSPYVSLCKGVLLKADKKLTDARSCIQKGVASLPLVVCGYVHLATCLKLLHTNTPCVETCQKGLKSLEKKDRVLTVSSKSVTTTLQLTLAACLSRATSAQSLTQAEEALKQITDDPSSKPLMVLVALKQKKLEEAEVYLQQVSDPGEKDGLEARVLLHKGENMEAMAKLEKLSDSCPDVSENHFLLGRVLWQLREGGQVDRAQERCFKSFLKAAKLDPYNSEIFLYLGHFYFEVQDDKLKAKRCYQKAYDLDPDNEEAGAALCDMLVAVGEDEEAKQFLVTATSQARAGSGKWAWLRLGLHQVKHEDPTLAVTSFQSALRADPKDNHVWECLAEAYLQRGSFTAALKTFTKAAELDPESVYSLFQIASIKQTLGEFPEAVAEYKTILVKSNNYVPGLKGLGETLLQLARQHLETYLDGLARDRCQEALHYLTRAASQRPDLSCLWKLMGDACTILHPLPEQTFRMELPSKLVQQTKSSQEVVSLGKMAVLQIGARCYGRALKSIPDSASLWHDLGVNYFHQSQLQDSDVPELSQKAEQSLRKAICLDPNNFRHWNALGVVACSKSSFKPALAQHCFIKSVEVESNNVVAWTNLGTLYLQHDNIQLAHEAFKVAQSLDPKYVACWIGQALIAEAVGHDDAMDLFRHTTELGNHLEGSAGYGSWVCNVLQDHQKRNTDLFQYSIKQMAAIPAAADALARYTARVKTDATAYNMYGLLLEHQELYNTAGHAFSSAIDLLEKDGTEDDLLLKVRINYGRVLCKGGNYAKSVDQFGKAGQLDKVEDLCFLGQVFYKLGRYQDSFQTYNQALGVAELDEDKSHIYSALGMVAYKFGDIEGAKTAFFQGSQTTAPSAVGLEALCSLGLLQSDATLGTAALQELAKLGPADPSLPDTTWLTAALHILQENSEAAKRCIQREIQKNPSCSRLWDVLSAVLLLCCSDLGHAAAQCARASQSLRLHNNKTTPTMVTLGQLSGGLHSPRDVNSRALSAAQRAFHLYPDQVSNKCSLIAAIHTEAVLSDSLKQRSYLNIEQRYIEGVVDSRAALSPGLALWCLRQNIISLIWSGKLDEAKAVLKQLSSLSADNSECVQFVRVLDSVLSCDVQSVHKEVTQQPTQLYLWQVLIEMYVKQGLGAEADAALRQALQTAQGDSRRQVQLETLIRLASLAFHQITSGSGDRSTLKSVFDEAADEIMKIDPGCSAIPLMRGAISMKNAKAARKHFQHALDAGSLRPSRGYGVSLARQAVVKNLLYNQKELEFAQKLYEDAVSEGDEDTVKLYRDLKGED